MGLRPDSHLLERVVHDSNNLGDPPQRRMNMSIVDNGERKLTVLNATAEETSRCVGSSEVRRWARELQRREIALPVQKRILDALKDAARRWFIEELDRPDGLLQRLPLTEDQELAIMELSLVMPPELFTGRDGPRKDIDRAMVAEAAVTRRTLLLTEDESTIRHVPANEWLVENGWSASKVLVQANSLAHQRLEEDAGGHALYEWMLGAYLPNVPSNNDVQIIERNAYQLELAGMRYASMRVMQELHADRDPAATFARVRNELPARARLAESRRLEATRAVVRDAGLSR